MIKRSLTLAAAGLLFASPLALAAPPAKIADLAWMTGTWAGSIGPNTLEENWIKPANGSIAAMVRMGGAAGIGMWEVITVEEKNGTLLMTVQQWGAGFEPRTPQAQKLELEEIGPQRVKFKAVTEGSVTTLGYSRNGDVFSIEAGQSKGGVAKLDLKAAR